ncbi:MAG TPA: glycosyltransferase family 4 protein [Vicinamibacterales bacterium]|nr:glycosyltransferase family 4 protein [Vicinamibacterales bacterium]
MSGGARPIRVAICSRFPEQPGRPRGGVESATVGLVSGLAARGDVDVHVVTLERGVERPRVSVHDGVTVHRLPRSTWPMLADVFVGPGRRAIDSYIRALHPDVVHFQETYGFGARGYTVPVVFTVHGFDSLNLRTERRRAWRLRAPLWRLAEQAGIGPHRHLVSIAPYVTRMLRRVSRAEIAEIPNAISSEFFTVARREVAGRVLFAGWLNPRKNLLAALEAVRLLTRAGQPIELHAAGAASDPAYAARIDEYIRTHQLAPHVRLLGSVPREGIREELSRACALVLPSLQENAPMVIAEALAAGVPVVATDACGIPDMVEEGRTGFLIDPAQPEMIADRLGRLLRDASLRSAMSAAARRSARERWHADAVAAATVALYQRLGAGARATV